MAGDPYQYTPVYTWPALPPGYTFTPIYPVGWQCPMCKMVYAPHIPSCDCQQPKETLTW